MKTTLRFILIATLIILNNLSSAQTFTDLNSQLPGLENGSAAWADIDNDGDLDVLLSSNLFRNDGNGIFTDVSPQPAQSVYAIPAMFMDYDKDSDADIFM